MTTDDSLAPGAAPARGQGIGVALVIGSCLSLQVGAAIATMLFPVLGSWGTTALRLGISALLLLVIIRPRVTGWQRKEWTAVLAFGLSLAAMNGFFYAAIERIPLGIAVSLEFLGPLVLAAALSRRAREFVWVGVAFVGMAVFFVDDLTGDERLDGWGVTFALVAAAFWATYILASHRVGSLTTGGSGLSIAFLIAALAVLPFGGTAYPAVFEDTQLLMLALGAALLASVIPYSFEFAALRRLPRPVFGILLSLEPVFATLAGWLMLGQSVSALASVAILMIVSASIGSTLTARK